jgi:C1A family cysteine protease
MEAGHFISTGSLLKLSEQQFVDCDHGSCGCGGGFLMSAFKYAKDHAIDLESDYVYNEKTNQCHSNKFKGKVNATSFVRVPPASVSQLKTAIAVTPVTVLVEATSSEFRHYTSGIIDSKNCGTQVNHAILAVGYGVENG